MTVGQLIESGVFRVASESGDLDREITGPYCCDLLSFAMGKAPAGSAWVTVMGNVNTLAVASLADVACIILAEGAVLDSAAAGKAASQGITVLMTEEPIFETAYKIYGMTRN